MGPLEERDCGWMVHDMLLWVRLISAQPEFLRPRFISRSIRDPLPLFPSGSFIFGEAGCDRLKFSVPACLYDQQTKRVELLNDADFVDSCLSDLTKAAARVQPGQRFYLLMIGHGVISVDGEFALCVNSTGGRDGLAFIPTRRLKLALSDCAGEVTIICNACHSGALVQGNPPWRLLCAAGAKQLSESLAASASGVVRGSAFTHSALAVVGQEHGLVTPSPRHDRRPKGTKQVEMAILPSAPPDHSFSTPRRHIHSPAPTCSVPLFISRMREHEQLLIYKAGNTYQQWGFDDAPWFEWLPLAMLRSLVDGIAVVADNRGPNGLSAHLNSVFHPPESASASTPPPPTISVPDDVDDQHLQRLAPLFMDLNHSYRFDRATVLFCQRFLQTQAEGDIRELPFLSASDKTELARLLRTNHLHIVVVQLLAAEFGWRELEPLASLMSPMDTASGEDMVPALLEAGVLVDDLGHLLLGRFNKISCDNFRPAGWWLALEWDRCGRPAVSLARWKSAFEAAATKASEYLLV
ncbi:hypothetical protein B0H16DRAFT_1883 [Mycena metata]|uniref:Uncharacterized protein n=1 Tax=Mycena metata TaxID=1033252 RepID=A0AAD7KIM3_9AGAR|nr:hypothetical protein B0H16DRAFT_1883 [Mycena metata]